MSNSIDEYTDQELVKRTLKERDFFEHIVSRYETKLSRYIFRIGARYNEEMKDILQESFIKIYVNLNDYDPALSFNAWVYRITHNETMGYFRTQKNRPQAFLNESDTVLFEMMPDDLDIFDEHTKKHEKGSLLKGLASIPQKYRDVLVLRYFEEKSYEEISDILEMPAGTVATLISRGKPLLRNALLNSHALDI